VTLQDLGNVGEVVGSAAVVISLLYLATQIRQNSRLLRASALDSQAHTGTAMLQSLAHDVQTAQVFTQGLRDVSAFSEAERAQFVALLGLAFLGFQTSWYLHRDGLSARGPAVVARLRAREHPEPGLRGLRRA
jgi:hypothetical protein